MSRSLTSVSGPVTYVHTYLNMYVSSLVRSVLAGGENLTLTAAKFRATHSFQLPNGTTAKTCPAALGTQFFRPRPDPENPPRNFISTGLDLGGHGSNSFAYAFFSHTCVIQAIPSQREQRMCCNLSGVAVFAPTLRCYGGIVVVSLTFVPLVFVCSDGPGALDFTQVRDFPPLAEVRLVWERCQL